MTIDRGLEELVIIREEAVLMHSKLTQPGALIRLTGEEVTQHY